jgi:hypothetical protein
MSEVPAEQTAATEEPATPRKRRGRPVTPEAAAIARLEGTAIIQQVWFVEQPQTGSISFDSSGFLVPRDGGARYASREGGPGVELTMLKLSNRRLFVPLANVKSVREA